MRHVGIEGKTLPVRTATAEIDVEIFVAVLPHSNLARAEAMPSQKICHWAMAHRRAMEYFGGTPTIRSIDNLESGVVKADREDPLLNPTFREFARHYGLAIIPARSRKPTDKGPVEAAVKAVQSRILLPLRHQTFFSTGAMNTAIRPEAGKLNTAPMASGERRRQLFEASERAALARLPAHPWEWGEWLTRKVAPNGHVSYGRNNYSVPEGHIGRQACLRIGERMLEVFLDRGGERIAVHRLATGRNRYATEPTHMPDRLKAVRDIRRPDYGDILLRRARSIGKHALARAERCLASRDFPQQAFTTVQGMVRLAERHGAESVDSACAEALDLDRLASGFLRERLKANSKAPPPRPEPDEIIPDHSNIRGGSYYSNTKGETT